MSVIAVMRSCKRHNPSYGYVYIDGKGYDICDVVRSLSCEKKEKIDKYDTYRSLYDYNSQVYLNNILLTKKELSFGEVSANDDLIERKLIQMQYELGEQQKEARRRQKETASRQKKSAMQLIKNNVDASERLRDALECRRENMLRATKRRQEIVDNQRATILKINAM